VFRRIAQPRFKTLGLLGPANVQKKFADCGSIFRPGALDAFDLTQHGARRAAGQRAARKRRQNVLIVGTIEDAQLALGRERAIDTP
jgi:hypothetical protein